MKNKRKMFEEMKHNENILRNHFKQKVLFQRIYESNNKRDIVKEVNKLLPLSDEEVEIIDDLSSNVIEYLNNKNYIENVRSGKLITINNYEDLLLTIHLLLDILEIELFNDYI